MSTLLRGALRARRNAVDRFEHARHQGAGRRLAARKPEQQVAWDALTTRTAAVYEQLLDDAAAPGVTPLWNAYLDALRAELLPRPPWDFRRNPVLLETMLVRGTRLRHRELGWLRRHMEPAALAAALEEDPVGDPALCSGDPLTSSTAIHHLFHLERLRAATGVRVGDARVIVEWGGGFGGFARTVRRTATGAPPAHVIIDLPLVSALQWTYLSTVFGEDHVDLALSAGHVPAPGRITLVPSHLAFDLDLRADVFVSLWGLSETSADTQDDVAASGFYGARHLLLAFQDDGPDTPDASRIGALGQAAGGRVEPVGVLANSAYVFA